MPEQCLSSWRRDSPFQRAAHPPRLIALQALIQVNVPVGIRWPLVSVERGKRGLVDCAAVGVACWYCWLLVLFAVSVDRFHRRACASELLVASLGLVPL